MAGLGNLPIAQDSGRQVSAARLPDASPDAFGAAQGRALEVVGQGFESLGGAAQALAARQERQAAFGVQTGLLQLENTWNQEQDTRANNVQPGADGFHKQLMTDLDAAANKYFAGVPAPLKAEVQAKLVAMRGRFEQSSSNFEFQERTRYHKQLIGDGGDVAAERLVRAPNDWRSADSDMNAQIENSGLSPVDQDALKRWWSQRRSLTLAAIQAKNDPQGFRQRVAPEVAGGGVVGPESLLRHEEGLRTSAYWDTDHYRVGYGSDTVTHADGTVESVTKDTVITKDDAERDLARRSNQSAVAASNQVGTVAWDRLDDATHAALVSVAYNYGSLPSSVVGAVRSGDKETIAAAVESLGSNKDRRAREAQIIRSGVGPDGTHGVAPEFQDLPFDKRLTLYEQSVTDQSQAETAARTEQARQAAQVKGTYELQIATDPEHVDARSIVNNALMGDGDKAGLYKSLQTALGISNDTRAAVLAYGNGTLALNPLLPADRGTADKVYEQITKNNQSFPNAAAAAAGASYEAAANKAITADFIGRTHIVPTTVAADLRRRLQATTPQQLATALTDSTNLYNRAGSAIDAMDDGKSIRDQVAEFRSLTDGRGMSPVEAAQNMLARRSTEWKVTDDALKTASEAFVKTLAVTDVTSALNPAGWTGAPAIVDPAAGAEMLADYQAIAKEKLVTARGDTGIAKAQALAELQTVWNVSNATGQRVVMKYPPERYYPPVEGAYDYLSENVAATVKTAADGAEIGQIELQPYQDTAADIRAGAPPRYILHYQEIRDGQPVWQTVLDGAWQMTPAELDGLLKTSSDKAATETGVRGAQMKEQTRIVEDARKQLSGPSPMLGDVNPPPIMGGKKPVTYDQTRIPLSRIAPFRGR